MQQYYPFVSWEALSPAFYSSAPENAVTAFAGTDSDGNEYEMVTEGSLKYWVYEDHAKVCTCDEKATGEIIIPKKINGVPVTSIGDSAFSNCKSLKSITIPDLVTSIGPYTFSGCESLISITIPDSVTHIPNRAFYNCTSLELINIPDSITDIGTLAFSRCTSLKEIILPDNGIKIYSGAFSGCTNLESITIPKYERVFIPFYPTLTTGSTATSKTNTTGTIEST